ncbi:MAG: hypothetical protein QOI99_1659 [Actinomycetota bacterium]|nr:hypothetical protein [Actinomycetota bacterium]
MGPSDDTEDAAVSQAQGPPASWSEPNAAARRRFLADGRCPPRRGLAFTAPRHPLPSGPPRPRPSRLHRRQGLRLAPWSGRGPSRRRLGGVRLPQHQQARHEHHLRFPRPHDRVGGARAPVGRDDRGPLPLLRHGRCDRPLPGLAALPRRHRLRPPPSRDHRCPGAPRLLRPCQCPAAPLGVGRRPQRLHHGHVGRRRRQLEAQRAVPGPVGGAGGDRGVIGRCHLRVDDGRPDQQLEPRGGRALRLQPGRGHRPTRHRPGPPAPAGGDVRPVRPGPARVERRTPRHGAVAEGRHRRRGLGEDFMPAGLLGGGDRGRHHHPRHDGPPPVRGRPQAQRG